MSLKYPAEEIGKPVGMIFNDEKQHLYRPCKPTRSFSPQNVRILPRSQTCAHNRYFFDYYKGPVFICPFEATTSLGFFGSEYNPQMLFDFIMFDSEEVIIFFSKIQIFWEEFCLRAAYSFLSHHHNLPIFVWLYVLFMSLTLSRSKDGHEMNFKPTMVESQDEILFSENPILA